MRKVAEQIAWKRKHGLPLVPDMKVPGVEGTPPAEPANESPLEALIEPATEPATETTTEPGNNS
jgi:hypothetical protein